MSLCLCGCDGLYLKGLFSQKKGSVDRCPFLYLPRPLLIRASPRALVDSMLQSLSLQNFRNFDQATLSDLRRVNVISGSNGSGKTSLLEAIHCLGSSRSFRTRKWQSLIRHGSEGFLIAGQLDHPQRGRERLGIQRERQSKNPLVKYRGVVLRSAGELAGVLPLQLIDSSAFQLLEGAPEVRRQWLDWGVFHVEQHRFVESWRRYRKALAQRNALLRRGVVTETALRPWTEELIRSGERVHALRLAQFERLVPLIQETYEAINQDTGSAVPLTYHYHAGWEVNRYSLEERLRLAITTDTELGYTRHGPHRADVRFKVDGRSALEVLSRGQLKTALCCIRIAQAKLLAQYGIKSAFLIDDLSAELDPDRRRLVVQALLALDMQLFMTSIESHDLGDCLGGCPSEQLQRFHVKHGRVSPSEA